jgi:hypothetical protein
MHKTLHCMPNLCQNFDGDMSAFDRILTLDCIDKFRLYSCVKRRARCGWKPYIHKGKRNQNFVFLKRGYV